jgi:hypothetical protein
MFLPWHYKTHRCMEVEVSVPSVDRSWLHEALSWLCQCVGSVSRVCTALGLLLPCGAPCAHTRVYVCAVCWPVLWPLDWQRQAASWQLQQLLHAAVATAAAVCVPAVHGCCVCLACCRNCKTGHCSLQQPWEVGGFPAVVCVYRGTCAVLAFAVGCVDLVCLLPPQAAFSCLCWAMVCCALPVAQHWRRGSLYPSVL